MNPLDVDQIHHIARLAILAMCARGVASEEFQTSPEVSAVRLTVLRPQGDEQSAIDLEFLGSHSIPLGGMSL